MNSASLIGTVAARYLQDQLESIGEDVSGTARFIVDCLTAEQTASVAAAILEDAQLAPQIEIKLPVRFMAGHGLPDSVLTDYRATHFRNAPCERPVLLVANTGDDEQQSLKELVPIGASQLQDRPDLWVRVAAEGLPLTVEHQKWWERALTGLRELRISSLDRLAEYVLRTRVGIQEEGLPVIAALGAALPALRIPRDSAYFNGLNEKTRGHTSRWKRLYDTAQKKRACFLLKQTPSQVPLSQEDLQATFERVKDSIPEAVHDIVGAFISAPAGWHEQAARLSLCEWEAMAPLFDGFKREPFNLGQATIDFYDERQAELLDDAEREYLRRLIRRKTTASDDEEDRRFYEDHRNELKEERKLKVAWDHFIFGKAFETEDFLAGIVLCMERLFSQQTPATERHLRIRCDRGTKKELRDLNLDAGIFFATRYRGLKALFGNKVQWEVGSLFDFPDLVAGWRAARKLNYSTARAALQLKFIIELEIEVAPGHSEVNSAQMIWQFNNNAVIAGYAQDWARLQEHPLVYCNAHRKPLSGNGQFQTVDLSNVFTFVPVFGKERGTFVGVYKKEIDIGIGWLQNLGQARQQNLITNEAGEILEKLFFAFQASYSGAISSFSEKGLASHELLRQMESCAALLDGVCTYAKGDRNRELLLRPLLRIGVVAVQSGRPTAVIAPWHPLRLGAVAIKAHLVSELIKRLLVPKPVEFGDSRLFFRDMQECLSHPFYPELAIGWEDNQPELLCATDTVGDYTLHESPVAADDGLDDTNENPADGANCVVDLVKRYLALQPHEHANLSVVLYNCDSSRLPQAVVEKIAAMDEDEENDVRCQVILRHRDAKRLRSLYEKIIASADGDPDAYSASEATRDFMARLRIGIMADQAPIPASDDSRPTDIVFSQDVIARHARVEWYEEEATPVDAFSLIPAHWSRRRPAASDDLKSVVYLCCPAQTAEGWSYLGAIGSFFKGNCDRNAQVRWIPARQLDFRDTTTARIFEETHNLATWVVNYDELLDRRQLLNQNVQVIRYKQSVTQGRNVVISSKAPLGLLRSMVLGRLKALNLELQDGEYLVLADRFLDDANEISGEIVLRAAKHGRNASELLGVVLSRHLIRHELGLDRLFGWYFLDDYSEWLGQREEQIADVLALSPELAPEGTLRLAAIISEAKYIDAAGVAAKRKESQKQLRDTVKRVNDAVFGNPERFDRTLWLSRLSDLILDGVQVPASAPVRLSEWRRAIRDGHCEIYVRGYSHIFVSGPTDAAVPSDFVAVADLENSFQEVFDRRHVRQLVLKYFRNEDATSIREDNAGSNSWLCQSFHRPSAILMRQRPEPEAERQPQAEPVPSRREIDVVPHAEASPARPAEPIHHSEPYQSEEDRPRWAYPSINALLGRSTGESSDSAVDRDWLRDAESKTKGALQQFQLQSKLVQSVLTPNSALLKFAGSANLTVEQVLRRQSEFLTTHGINIISVTPEPGVVSIAVERPHRQLVQLQDVWKRWRPNTVTGNQELLLGVREDNGELLFLSPGIPHAPHTLIAGSTGSGKSVLVQNLILGIAATNTPVYARIVLIDPKQGVDYSSFEELPHLQGGIIDAQRNALAQLRDLVGEMDSRYSKLRSSRSNSLAAYNQKIPEGERLPVIWVIHDEFAEWMLVDDYKEEVTSLVSRLGVKARAAGIHLVFAAQRPDANVMPMQLRANLGNRLILRVDSQGTSEIALGEKGAERLLGRGHLLAKLEGCPLAYAQVPFLDTAFIDNVVGAIRTTTHAGGASV